MRREWRQQIQKKSTRFAGIKDAPLRMKLRLLRSSLTALAPLRSLRCLLALGNSSADNAEAAHHACEVGGEVKTASDKTEFTTAHP